MTSYRPTRRVTRTAVVGLAVAVGVLSSSACGGQTSGGPAAVSSSSAAPPSTSSSSTTAGPATSSTSEAPKAPTAAAAKVTIKDFEFGVPASVAPGTAVTVTNEDAEAHTVTSKDAGFDVKVAGRGGTVTFTAPKAPGSYKLTCDFHADMAGVLVVS